MLIHKCIWLCDVCVQKRMKATTVKVQQQTWKQTCTCSLSAGFAGQNSCCGILRPWSGKAASLTWFLCYQYFKCVSLLACQLMDKKVVFLSSYYVRDKNSNVYYYITRIHHNNNNIIIFDHPMMDTSQNAQRFSHRTCRAERPRLLEEVKEWTKALTLRLLWLSPKRVEWLGSLGQEISCVYIYLYIYYIMLTNKNVYQ